LVTGSGGAPLLELTYGHAATIWRINKGWRRRKPESPLGFVLDVERGYWEKGENEDDEESDEQEAATGPRKQRVIPYVADRRNCLLIKPAAELPVEVMASLQPALKNAIQVLYQIEDNELAAEPLPDAENRRQILFYEAAEGGAGVLRQLLDDPQALVQVARTALRICHFDPVTGEDLLHAERSRENCEAACYDCLMSYTNQTDHRLLDRQTIWAFLRELAQAAVAASPTAQPRTAHLADLQAQADSSLEQAWLAFAERHRLRLPDKAQVHIPTADCSADFLYENDYVVIFVDGPVHDQAHIAARDRQIERALADLGYTALRFRWDEQALWPALAAQQSWLFGQIDDGSQHS
jgi:very-short-patch-repair endonuclease